jgi:hypothetical protein
MLYFPYRFFTYGNFSLCGHLKQLNQDYLQYYVKSAVNTEIPYEPRWLEPVSTVLSTLDCFSFVISHGKCHSNTAKSLLTTLHSDKTKDIGGTVFS